MHRDFQRLILGTTVAMAIGLAPLSSPDSPAAAFAQARRTTPPPPPVPGLGGAAPTDRRRPVPPAPAPAGTPAPAPAARSDRGTGARDSRDRRGGAAEPAIPSSDRPDDPLLNGWQPETAADFVQSALWMINREAWTDADGYLAGAKGLVKTDADRAQLYRAFGPGPMLRLQTSAGLSAESRQFARDVIAGADRVTMEPARLAELAGQIAAAGGESQWRQLTRQILSGGDLAAAALVNELSRATTPEARRYLRSSLIALGTDALGPCWGGLESNQSALMADCLEVFAYRGGVGEQAVVAAIATLGSSHAEVAARAGQLVQRLGGLVDTHSLTRLLCDQVEGRLRDVPRQVLLVGELPAPDQPVRVWSWRAGQVEPQTVAAQVAKRIEAARLAEYWQQLDLGDPVARRMSVALRLEIADAWKGRVDDMGAELRRADALSTTELLKALDWSNRQRLDGASILLCRALAERADASAWLSANVFPTVLVDTMNHSQLRVQLAAAEAVGKLLPSPTYSGASYWERTRRFLSTATGQRRALVAHGRQDRAEDIGNILRTMGWEVDVVGSGRELRLQAPRHADYRLVVLDPSTGDPTVGHLIEQLEGDPRTSRLPILMVSVDPNVLPVTQHADLVPGLYQIPEPLEPADLVEILDRIEREFARTLPSQAELSQIGEQVRKWTPAQGAMLDDPPVSATDEMLEDITEPDSSGAEPGSSVAAPLSVSS
ncbi:MAG: hypothetical protein U0795_21170 [Pirellulales bacterium]